MKTQLMIFALFGILITSVGSTPVFGENESVTVTIDKSSYSDGETISISGEIEYLALGNQLSIVIQAPNGNIVALDQITVGSDKQFSTEIKLGGKLMKQEGTYTIKVTQDENNQVTTSFEFGGGSSSNELDIIIDSPITATTVTATTVTATTVTVEDSTDLISYEITNGKIINIMTDMDAKSLLIDIEAWDDGSITLTIPRSVLDAKINDGGDDEFFVLLDGEEVDFEEITTSTDRTLTIEFFAGSEQIEIIGTFVIPEFGTIAAMILAVAIISIIAISAKSRLSIPSRY
jgi:predicted secreted protein with PEFG-CTERM motif